MKIRKLRASFGRLAGDTLQLEDGLNIVRMDNEGGKSTWSAFIMAMLYGIDTSEKASAGKIPDKTRYKPWDGRPMEGYMEVETEGRMIALERSTKGAAVMKQFSAADLATGQNAGYDGETVGQMLTGVSREVYRRSALIRQGTVKIDNSPDLERQLLSMATGGSEDTSYGEARERLSQWQKSLKNRQGGEISRLEEEARALEEKLRAIGALSQSIAQAKEELETLAEARAAAEKEVQAHRAKESLNLGREIAKARMEVLRLEAALKKLTGGRVPPAAPRLLELERKVQAARDTAQRLSAAQEACDRALSERESFTPEETAFDSLTEEQAQAQVEAKRLEAASRRGGAWIFFVLAVIFAALTAVGTVLSGELWAIIVPAALCVGCIVVFPLLKARQKKRRTQAEAALHERTAQLAAHQTNLRQLSLLEEKAAEAEAVLEAARQAFESQEQEATAFASEVLGGSGTLDEIPPALEQAYAQRESYSALSAQYDAAVRFLDTISQGCERTDGKYDLESVPETTTDKQEALERLASAEKAFRACESRIFHLQGQLAAAGDYDKLFARREQLGTRKAAAQAEYDAITLAIDKLDLANEELSMLFSPALNEKAGAYFARLTGGKYEGLFLNRALEARIREAGGVVNREAGLLSAGAGDQLYLAVRLAICELLLPEGKNAPPIILDDVLGSFDDARMGYALDLLTELASERQIILFTCQGREEDYLRGAERLRGQK